MTDADFMNLVASVIAGVIKVEGQGPAFTNPGNLRDAPWFPLWRRPAGDATTSAYWPDKVPRRQYPDGSLVERIERFRGKESIGFFWNPRTRPEGLAGAAHVVWLHVAELDTLSGLISKTWAPATDANNDPRGYVKMVATHAGVADPNKEMVAL